MTARGRILFFADARQVHTRRWVDAMAERGFECVVGTRAPGAIAGAAEVVPIAAGSDALGWFRAVPAVRALARRVAPQWVHGHYVTSYGLWAAACRGIAPVVLTAWGSDILVTPRERGLRGTLMHGLVGWSLRRADLVTADAQEVLDEIRRYGGVGAPCREVLWGVDTQRFCPADVAPGDPGRFEVISLRQWEPNYRIDLTLRALAALRAARPSLRVGLTLLGGGSQAAALHALAAELGLDGATTRFVGRVDDAGMVAALQRADVSVSVPASDATSVAMLESMACGLAVVATDLPANRPWIDAAQRVPVDDLPALTSALIALADDPATRRDIGRRNRQAVLERAARAAHMDRMAALYESLRAQPREAAA
jgi:glycosyltransferase involved in cell wall biosynthesis